MPRHAAAADHAAFHASLFADDVAVFRRRFISLSPFAAADIFFIFFAIALLLFFRYALPLLFAFD
jgi:hypothetical protein